MTQQSSESVGRHSLVRRREKGQYTIAHATLLYSTRVRERGRAETIKGRSPENEGKATLTTIVACIK